MSYTSDFQPKKISDFCQMEFMIGNEIKKIVKERGLTNVAFADKMDMEERNLYHFFKKKQLGLDQLLKASEVLDYDFVSLYIKNSRYSSYLTKLNSENILMENTEEYLKSAPDPKISFTVNILGRFDKITQELPEIMKILKSETEARGLQLG